MSVQEEFFISAPVATDETLPAPFLKEQDKGKTIPAYRADDGALMAWSSTLPLPAVGSKVYVTMNGIGNSIVKGYFRSHGGEQWFLGLMIAPTRPPKFYRENIKRDAKNPNVSSWRKEGIGCVFGSEIGIKPKATSK